MEYFKRYTGTESVSIVNALAEMGENSSYANRKLIAAANGIADYSGTATQNLLLLSLLKDGKLIKPGTDAPAQPENTAEPTKQGFGRKVLIGALVLGAGIAAYKMFGNDEPKTATKKSGKKKATKKKSRKGLNGVNCSYYTNESSGVSIVSDNRKEFKQMLKDYAAQHPDKNAGGVAFMRHKNGNEEIMYGFSMRDGVVVFEPRIGNKKYLNGSTNRPPRVKTLSVADGKKFNISQYPNISTTGSIVGWRKQMGKYGKTALMVRCGSYIYNVDSAPEIYEAAH